MANDVMFGTPSAVLLPARRYRLTHSSGPYTIDIDITADVQDTAQLGRKVKAVSFFPDEDMDLVVDFNAITKILFASSSYPKLADGQVFTIANVIVDKKAGRVTVVGNILEMKE